jgi:drug/metabolite transporter (DMT)-like permease
VSIQSKELQINNKKGVLYGIFTMVSWGLSLLILGYLVKETNRLIVILTFRIVTWLYGVMFFNIKKISLSITKRNIFYLLILIGFLDLLGTIFYGLGISKELISIVGPISALYPAITLIMARIFMKEILLNIQKIGIVSIFLGLTLISI